MSPSKPGADPAPGARHERPAAKKIMPSMIVLGDALLSLAALTSEFPSESGTLHQLDTLAVRPVSLVIAKEASRVGNRRKLSALLREITLDCVALSAKLPKLRHVIVVLENSAMDASVVLASCEQAAARLHEQVAREHGDYVVVTFLLVADSSDPAVLARRITDRAAQPQATDTTCALSWSEIEAVPIELAAMNHYI